METKYSPTPWRRDKSCIRSANGYAVCNLHDLSQTEANGALIEAAPDLLTACKAAHFALGSNPADEIDYELYKMLGNAIAKAERG